MRFFLSCLALLSALCLGSARAQAQGDLPLSRILVDLGPAGWSDVRDAAYFRAQNGAPQFLSARQNHQQSFVGVWEPASIGARLAVHSDDGCDVWVNGVKVIGRRFHDQALPDLARSLQAVPFDFEWGKSYYIRVDYSNTIHLGAGDIDGITLFAYDPEDLEPVPTPSPTPPRPDYSEEPKVTLSFPQSKFKAGSSPSVRVTISGPTSGKHTVTLVDTRNENPPIATIELVIGGAPGANSGSVVVPLPSPARRTFRARFGGATHDVPITVYGYSTSFTDSVVAAGNTDTPAHRARFVTTVSDGVGPVPDAELPAWRIVSGGRGPTDAVTAKVVFASNKPDAQGRITGYLLSGHRTEDTTFKIENQQHEVKQVWNEETYPWSFDPYFEYDQPSTLSYTLSYSRGPIDEHEMRMENTAITGWKRVPASYDFDGDGVLDDAYWPKTFTSGDQDTSGWNAYESLSEWGSVSESSPGTYEAEQTIRWNEVFIIDNVSIAIVDDSAFGINGKPQ